MKTHFEFWSSNENSHWREAISNVQNVTMLVHKYSSKTREDLLLGIIRTGRGNVTLVCCDNMRRIISKYHLKGSHVCTQFILLFVFMSLFSPTQAWISRVIWEPTQEKSHTNAYAELCAKLTWGSVTLTGVDYICELSYFLCLSHSLFYWLFCDFAHEEREINTHRREASQFPHYRGIRT